MLMMFGNSISDKRTVFEHPDDEMMGRHMACIFALTYELRRSVELAENFRCACVPKLSSWEEVVKTNNEIEELKVACANLGVTLFKIPSSVNDIDGYVAMLLRDHLR